MKIILTRDPFEAAAPGRRGPRWHYSYALNGGMPPAVDIGYGSHLGSLRDMLKRRFPGATVIDSWKVN